MSFSFFVCIYYDQTCRFLCKKTNLKQEVMPILLHISFLATFLLAENRSKRENYIYIKTMRLFSPKRVKPTFSFTGLTICVRLISVCKPITQLRTINFVTFVTF